jgi:hypothetical protein
MDIPYSFALYTTLYFVPRSAVFSKKFFLGFQILLIDRLEEG